MEVETLNQDGTIVVNGTTETNPAKVSNGDSIQLKMLTSASINTTVQAEFISQGEIITTWDATTTGCPGGSGTQTYDSSGIYTFTLPANTETCTFDITLEGGGGGAAGVSGST